MYYIFLHRYIYIYVCVHTIFIKSAKLVVRTFCFFYSSKFYSLFGFFLKYCLEKQFINSFNVIMKCYNMPETVGHAGGHSCQPDKQDPCPLSRVYYVIQTSKQAITCTSMKVLSREDKCQPTESTRRVINLDLKYSSSQQLKRIF